MKISLKKLHLYAFAFMYLLVFFLSGFLQFFLGVPYVVLSFLLIVLLTCMVFLSLPNWNFKLWDKVVIFGVLYAVLIVFSGIINGSDVLHILIYLFFPLFPLLFYIFLKSGIQEKAFYRRKISLITLYTACLQFPFIVAQRMSYDFMKGFNRSGQELVSVDFWFGTFPFKADHALGLFMLFNILNIYWNNDKLKLTKYPWVAMIWIAFTVFLTDTKITQLIIALLFVVHAYMVVPKKVRIIGVMTVVIAAITAIFFLKQIPILKSEYEYSQKAYTLKHTKWTFEKHGGVYARRVNIIIYYINYRPLTFIGNGPYDYFNFKEGKFRQTHHFSQLIWTYNDLGLWGIITVVLFMFYLVKSLALSHRRMWLIFIVLMIYAFMTVALFDFALIMSLLLVLNNKFLDESDSDTLS